MNFLPSDRDDFWVESTLFVNDPEEGVIPIHLAMPKGVQMALFDWDYLCWRAVLNFSMKCVDSYKEKMYEE